MKFLLSPDKFKGSLDGYALAQAMARGIGQAMPEARCIVMPLADGGEGTELLLRRQRRGRAVELTVHDALMRPISAGYSLLENDEVAVIEMARASGLAQLIPAERAPLRASTYGTGELMRDAVQRGVRRILVCIGGSATTDGGSGLARALGYRLLDARGQSLSPGGGSLIHLRRIERSPDAVDWHGIEVKVACDVTNPLHGPQGAAKVYAPQKGATPEQVDQLDRGLRQLARVWQEQWGRDLAQVPGAGAAGGLGAGLMAFTGATLAAGIELVMQELDYEAQLATADWIITGEGRLDGQTLSGKVIQGLCQLARQHGVPTAALCGSVTLTPAQQQHLGLAYATSVVPGPVHLSTALQQADAYVQQAAFSLAKLLSVARAR